MQCYESEVMRRQLMSYVDAAMPGTQADPLYLDEALADGKFGSLAEVLALTPDERTTLVGQVLGRDSNMASRVRG